MIEPETEEELRKRISKIRGVAPSRTALTQHDFIMKDLSPENKGNNVISRNLAILEASEEQKFIFSQFDKETNSNFIRGKMYFNEPVDESKIYVEVKLFIPRGLHQPFLSGRPVLTTVENLNERCNLGVGFELERPIMVENKDRIEISLTGKADDIAQINVDKSLFVIHIFELVECVGIPPSHGRKVP